MLILALFIAIVVALSPFVSGLLGAAVLYVICVKPYRRLTNVPLVPCDSCLTSVSRVIQMPITTELSSHLSPLALRAEVVL